MLDNNSTTPPPRAKARFSSNLRRSLRSNSQLTSLPESLFDPPVSQTLFSAPLDIPALVDSNSPSSTSSISSHPSSPASSTLSRQLSPRQRRHASSVSQLITFRAAYFLEDRDHYSNNPGELCLSHEMTSDETLGQKDELPSAPLFGIPAAPRSTTAASDDVPRASLNHYSSHIKKPLRSELYVDFAECVDCLPEFMYNPDELGGSSSMQCFTTASGSSRPEISLRLSDGDVPPANGWEYTSHEDSYCSEAYPPELGMDDSPTLGYQPEFPGPAPSTSAPTLAHRQSDQSHSSRCRIVNPGSLLIPLDYDYLTSILDTPRPIEHETFADSLVGMAY
ncbi:hypothetical protein VP01_54g3 [Puccinia sorghi]|uniref:Uncharacterized protein n=1 Tax=Puccinia sorghi TaxID=27349 RepID=A0A0L6ULF1_9BASI|nr:hypothetical protein VP01_54g3 [Puccinia sorghi]